MKKQIWLLSVLGFASMVSAGELAESFKKSPQPVLSGPLGQNEMDNPGRGILQIGIEHTHCFGSCPIYSATIDKDGTVNYNGEMFVEKMGKFQGKIEPIEFARLAQFIQEEGYQYLANEYSFPASDQPSTYTMVRSKGLPKIIKDYGQAGPAKLWAIEQLIDKMVDASHLTPVKTGAEGATPAK